MFSRSIKTNIAIHLAVLLVLAMILIGFVTIIIAQKFLRRSEISKGYVFISGIEATLMNFSESENIIGHSDFQDNFGRMVNDAGFSCGLIIDSKKKSNNFQWQKLRLARRTCETYSTNNTFGKKNQKIFRLNLGGFLGTKQAFDHISTFAPGGWCRCRG